MISFANMLPITIFSQLITNPTLPDSPPVILTVTKTSALVANVCPANFSTPSSDDGTCGTKSFSSNIDHSVLATQLNPCGTYL